ncbi:MAG: hypothetical protein JSV95_02335 [Gemmatimonadota bacterium]|jgi:hypothetical protein|nr:MAG: hypothetical protein JSV95_02335 [Gemmatimonadota bacterium]
MTRHFLDEDGRRWKAWLASRDVYWPEPDEPQLADNHEAVIVVCFSDPAEPQRRVHLPSGCFQSLSTEDLREQLLVAASDTVLG